jgi:hypothetical protein
LAPVGDVSPDGKWLWDGHQWVSTLSPDGTWRWNGTTWVAAPTTPAGDALVPAAGLLHRIPGFRTHVPWKMAVAAIAYVAMGAIVIGIIGAAAGGVGTNGSPVAQIAASPSASPSASPTTPHKESPSALPSPKPSPKPSSEPSPKPSPKPSPRPKPSPIPKPPPVKNTCGAPANPWGYNFCGGQFIYSPASGFCGYFNCIASFWTSTNGYVDQCVDGTYSHSGGRQGACSHHGGERRPLYR